MGSATAVGCGFLRCTHRHFAWRDSRFDIVQGKPRIRTRVCIRICTGDRGITASTVDDTCIAFSDMYLILSGCCSLHRSLRFCTSTLHTCWQIIVAIARGCDKSIVRRSIALCEMPIIGTNGYFSTPGKRHDLHQQGEMCVVRPHSACYSCTTMTTDRKLHKTTPKLDRVLESS